MFLSKSVSSYVGIKRAVSFVYGDRNGDGVVFYLIFIIFLGPLISLVHFLFYYQISVDYPSQKQCLPERLAFGPAHFPSLFSVALFIFKLY